MELLVSQTIHAGSSQRGGEAARASENSETGSGVAGSGSHLLWQFCRRLNNRSEGTAAYSPGTNTETPICDLSWCRFSGLEDHVEFSGSCRKYAIDRIKIRFQCLWLV